MRSIDVFLATTDKNEDFALNEKCRQYGGKSRNRIIAEYELDGIYILGDFRPEWESSKVKHYEQIFEDLAHIFRRIHSRE